MNPRPVALWAALLPFLAVHLTYLVAASHQLVDWCFPYIDSCTSISATGRQPPASYLFRATMLPAAVIFVAYWWLNRAWLRAVAPAVRGRALDWMLWLGVLACCGLVAYTVVLGEAGERWQRQRRVGIVLYFSLSFLAQLLFAGQLRARAALIEAAGPYARVMLGNCAVLLCLGLATVIWQLVDDHGYDAVEHAFEWVLALLLQVNYLLGYLLWRRADWRLSVVPGAGFTGSGDGADNSRCHSPKAGPQAAGDSRSRL
ncbi:hypothetical protein [Parahaliea mediterranea]|uniref:CWH43-like N-terminal domain-containing protein n=1 Tax=Parahaliea mediterranea TaxID=651086 RepID=A0A939DF84_9GAMM|nr:hypothetical protein [Parahaliea mediterranea]MBN7797074.1 hypothetical protein [Parahaliea mediterranea]